MLEQLGGSKEQSCCFLCPKCFPDIEKVDYSREECSALPWADGGLVEYTGLLNDSGFVIVIRAEAALFLLFRRGKRHSKGGHLAEYIYRECY